MESNMNWIDRGSSKDDLDKAIDLLFDALKLTYRNGKDTWIINPQKLKVMSDAFERIGDCFDGEDIKIECIPFDTESELGIISIRSEHLIVCKDTIEFVKICKSGKGFDILAQNDGTTDITISFATADRVEG